MPCGKKPLVKNWSKHRNIRVITPSRFEKNEASVKAHWKKAINDLELNYKDDKFWESQCDTVRDLVGPVIFQRLAKIFNLPLRAEQYEPKTDDVTPVPSESFYMRRTGAISRQTQPSTFSMTDFEPSIETEEEAKNEELDEMTEEGSESVEVLERLVSRSKPIIKSKSFLSKSFAQLTAKSSSKLPSKSVMKSYSSYRSKSSKSFQSSAKIDESAKSDDDLDVHPSIKLVARRRQRKNPHFEMLYCNESETNMIKWKSKYKQQAFQVSASDAFSNKVEILTKQIALDFYKWWVGLGNVEFKSEIKRPEDIEDLFQVWFDEHASRGLVLDPKILPCVLQSIADYVNEPKAACPKVLKRQVAWDIHAETCPAHTMAFNTCLPLKMKHLPPRNNTKAQWDSIKIPEDLRTMACVWDDIPHLTSTKAFHSWLQQRSYLPMPPCLEDLGIASDKKQLFVVPSDYVIRDRSVSSTTDLALPVSQFSLELKEVLDKLMN